MPDQTPKRPSVGGKPSSIGGPAESAGKKPPTSGNQTAAASSAAKAQQAKAQQAKAQQAKAQQSEYQYLPVQCPNCGLEGKVKISRLDRTFTCKQCKKVFHCALDGTVSGERPPDFDPMALDAPVSEPPSPWFVRVLGGLPRPLQWTSLGLLGLGVLYGLVMLLEPAEPLPDELGSRAKLAAESFGHGDWKTLKRMAFKGTAGSLGTWFDRARPKEWADVTKDSSVNVEVVSVDKQLRGYSKKTDQPIMDATSIANIHVAGKPEASQRDGLAFCWKVDDEQKYWLDGERMLGEYKPAKRKLEKKASASSPGN